MKLESQLRMMRWCVRYALTVAVPPTCISSRDVTHPLPRTLELGHSSTHLEAPIHSANNPVTCFFPLLHSLGVALGVGLGVALGVAIGVTIGVVE